MVTVTEMTCVIYLKLILEINRIIMKKIYLSIFIFSLVGCDPINNLTYKIDNSSSSDLKIYFYSSVEVENDTLNLPKKSIIVWRIETDPGSPSAIPLDSHYDSINLKSSNNIIKKYIPNSSGKNIFDYSYWIRNKKGKRDDEYIFEITEDDLPDPGGG